jgi:hypothetical protein
LLNKKRSSINKFALQIEDAPVYIVYHKKDGIDKITITDVGNNSRKSINVNLNDSMVQFLFILSLIRDEYKSKKLFTNKSQLI